MNCGGSWYNFDDTRITEIDVTTIPKESFGGIPSNGYMLFYEKISQN
jgi:ubiquitin C-terminal hydrolase